jgi:hypothetical protein
MSHVLLVVGSRKFVPQQAMGPKERFNRSESWRVFVIAWWREIVNQGCQRVDSKRIG